MHARLPSGASVRAHLGDPGRLRELLVPGARLRLRIAPPGGARRTRYTVALADAGDDVWVSLEPGRANTLARDALAAGRVRGVAATTHLRPEVRRGGSRFDFVATTRARTTWIEVKQVSFAEDGIARFPDAPTARGRRHVAELIDVVAAGDAAMVLFVAARADARCVTPYRAIDPEFAEVLRRARRAGVALRAARFRLDANARAVWTGSIPVRT